MPVHRDRVEVARNRFAVYVMIAAIGAGIALAVWFLWWLQSTPFA